MIINFRMIKIMPFFNFRKNPPHKCLVPQCMITIVTLILSLINSISVFVFRLKNKLYVFVKMCDFAHFLFDSVLCDYRNV